MIYKYSMFGDNIVFDVNSNSVYKFDDIAFDLVDMVNKIERSKIIELFKNKYRKEKIYEALKEINQLIDEGYLTNVYVAEYQENHTLGVLFARIVIDLPSQENIDIGYIKLGL